MINCIHIAKVVLVCFIIIVAVYFVCCCCWCANELFTACCNITRNRRTQPLRTTCRRSWVKVPQEPISSSSMATASGAASSHQKRCYNSKPGGMGAVARGNEPNVPRKECYNGNHDYTIDINNWLHSTNYYAQSELYTEQKYEHGQTSVWECSRHIQFQYGFLKDHGWGMSKKEARNRADYGIADQINMSVKFPDKASWPLLAKELQKERPRVQADGAVSKESNQGLTQQDSEKDSNTIVTRDEGITRSEDTDMCDLSEYLSAEKVFQFPDLVGRWMPLESLEVGTEKKVSDFIATYFLPEDLFKKAQCAPNLVPFEAFIYSKLDIEMLFVVNAQKFHCGKVIASVKFDSYQGDLMQNTAMAALNRPHVILDLATNNQGVLKIPFRYHRGFVRNLKNDNNSKGVRPSKFASVYVQYLSPLRTGKEGSTNMFITPYYKIAHSRFAGMSYRAAVQMDLANDVINTAYKTSGLKEILTRFEKMAHQFGSSANRDKPIDYTSAIFIPRPRMNFGTGKGLSDAQPLRNNPLSLTSSKWVDPFDDEPQTTTQIARIWGLRDSFTWKADSPPGTELWKSVVDPTARTYGKRYIGTPTPLEYVCSMYNFWTGSLEMRFDFVSNAFHTGAVMISIEFGRPVVLNSDACTRSSTYTKTFHLGEQKSVCVTIPYIYDTPLRRTTATTFNPNFSSDSADLATDDTRYKGMNVRPESKTLIRVSVINDLRPIATTTQEIDVLVFMRAGQTFVPHSLKQCSFVCSRERVGTAPFMDSFPRDAYKISDDKRVRRSAKEFLQVPKFMEGHSERKINRAVSFKDLPPEVRNEWNEYKQGAIPLPQVQADKGDKEDPDPTADFQHGRIPLKIQTSDLQTSIKDILRRPVLMVYRHTIKSNLDGGSHFFLPIMPPSREMAYHADAAQEFSNLIGQTPQAALMNLYRFWRGGSRYTIFLHSGSAEPIYITHVPHSGTRILGNQIIGNKLAAGKERPIIGCGLTTEPLLPTVNSSAVVEVPYDTENLWTLTFEEDTQRNYSWRDKGDTNAGHLAITATSDTLVSIWWSAGDDFEVSNFYGIPDCYNRDQDYAWPDVHGRVQMDTDFPSSETRTSSSTLSQIKDEVVRLFNPRTMTKIAVGSIPFVGPAAVGAPVVTAIEGLTAQTTSTMKNLNKAVKSVEMTSDTMQAVASTLIPIMESITGFCGTLTTVGENSSLWLERLGDFITDLALAWYQRSWVQVGVSCVKLMAKMMSVSFFSVSSYATELGRELNRFFSIQVQAPSTASTIVGVIAGIVGVAFGAHVKQERYHTYGTSLSGILTSTGGISYLNQMIRFMQTTFDMVKDMVLDLLGYASPEAVALKMLSGRDLTLKKFIVNAQSVINEANSRMVLHPKFRTMFWYTVTQAYQVQQVLSMVPTNIVSPQLARLCTEVIKVGNERMMDLSCSPVRYEPFVICVEGLHGIGKSHMTDQIVAQLLQAVGFTRNSSGWTYTRAPGSKFWSGYRDQPAVIYDDWLNLNDAQLMSQQISELYQLKSTSTFIPEMAHLEEKRIKANPMMVILLCNGAFPSGMANVAHHPKAVYRRRDVVLRAEKKPEFAGVNPRDLEGKESLNIAHLQFRKYGNSCDAQSISSVTRDWEPTIAWLAQTFQRYHAQEEVNVRNRIAMLKQQLNIGAEDTLDFEDPFSLMYKAVDFISAEDMATNAWLPSEQLEAAVTEIVEKIRVKKQMKIPIIVPPPPDDIFVQYDCCPATWQELARWFARGAILTPDLWAKITDWTIDGLKDALEWINEKVYHEVTDECCVCNEVKPVAYACFDSDARHKICSRCWSSVRALSPTIACPICRSVNVGLFTQPADGLLATMLMYCASVGDNYLVPVLHFISKLLGSVASRALSKLMMIGELIIGLSSDSGLDTRRVAYLSGRIITAEAVDTSETFYDAVSEMSEFATEHPSLTLYTSLIQPAVRHYHHDIHHEDLGDTFVSARQPIITQMEVEDDWTQPFIRDSAPEPEDPLAVCELNEVGFQACREPKLTLLPQCYHSKLMDNIESIVYRDSQVIGPSWQVALHIRGQDELIMVLDNPCQHHCAWERENVHRAFCEKYIELNKARIARAQVRYVGALQVDPLQFLKTLPRFARPSWAVQPALSVTPHTDDWWTYLSDSYSKYKRTIQIVGLASGALGAAYLTYKQLAGWFINPTCAPSQQQINLFSARHSEKVWSMGQPQSDPNYNPEHTRFIQRSQRNVRPVRVPKTQGGDELGDVVERYICQNYVRIIMDFGKTTRYLTAVGICGHYAIIPRHYVAVLQEEATKGTPILIAPAMVEWAGTRYARQVYNFDIGDFELSPCSDIAVFHMPASYKMFKDIRKFIMTQKDLDGYISSEGKIIVAPTRETQIASVVPVTIKGYQESELFDNDDTTFESFHILSYNYSRQGACGSLVCVEKHQRPIVSMHCAGQGEGVYGIGYGVILTQESLAEVLPTKISLQMEEREFGTVEDAKFIFDEACQVEYIGTVPVTEQPHIPTKSKIERSLLHNRFGFKAQTEPTILSQGDLRYEHEMSPLFYGARKHGLKTKDFKSSMVNRAAEALWTGWLSSMTPAVVNPKRLTPEQAVLGFEGNKYYEAISQQTSSGYPWNLGAKTTKGEWMKVDFEERTCTIDPKLLQEIQRKETLRKQGEVPITIFVDTLKDERKPSAKIKKAGSTRVFCASPVDYTIALRQNYLHFCASYMKNRHEIMHAVGIDVHGSEWARLWTRLTKHGTKFIGLDYSNFGPAFNACVAKAASDLMKRWTLANVADCDELELDTINWECDQSVHLCGNTLYQQQCGSPSGASITVIKNSLVNQLYIMCAWIALCERRVKEIAIDLWMEFRENVELCVYGDDLVMTVSETYIDIFNAVTIQKWFAQYGIISTDATKKGGEIQPYVSKDEITFLKRGWRRHPIRFGQFLAPLDLISVNDITQWVWKSPDRAMATRVNCESALLEAHGLGADMYEALRLKINTALHKLGIVPITMTWYDVDQKYYESEEHVVR